MDDKTRELSFLPDAKLLSAVIENARAENELAKEYEDAAYPNFSTFAQKAKTEEEVRLEILISSTENAASIYSAMLKEEESKGRWRTRFILFFSIMLVVATAFTGVLVYAIAVGKATVPTELLIAIFTYIFANIFSILFFMVKYVSNNQHLETFNTVTKKLLDYLIQDKTTTENSKEKDSLKSNKTKSKESTLKN